MENDMFLDDEIIILLGKTFVMKSKNIIPDLTTNKSTEKSCFFIKSCTVCVQIDQKVKFTFSERCFIFAKRTQMQK